ncbi:hypothetical protein GOODEAATRI_023308 [Goodea atripinnis]|uniref:Secreted protein n=1 Tax=Goodea atripinnis TaxID=208336 RepID=A0ABV0ND30_9TELE
MLLRIQACCSMIGCMLPGIGFPSPACQVTKVPDHGKWRSLVFSAVALQCTSLSRLFHQGTAVTEHMYCHRGSKSQLTGSVVRINRLTHPPLGVSHWVLKSPGCLVAFKC